MISRFEQFSFVISGIYRYILKLERDEMIKYGYKGAFAQYLAALSRFPEGLTCARLCSICDKDKAAVSRIVTEMEAKGLVVRQGDSERLYRAPVILTETGKEVATYVQERARIAVDAANPDMSEAERKTFYSALDHIAARLQALSREGIPADT